MELLTHCPRPLAWSWEPAGGGLWGRTLEVRILGLSFPKVESEQGAHLDKHLGRKRDMGPGVARERHQGL